MPRGSVLTVAMMRQLPRGTEVISTKSATLCGTFDGFDTDQEVFWLKVSLYGVQRLPFALSQCDLWQRWWPEGVDPETAEALELIYSEPLKPQSPDSTWYNQIFGQLRQPKAVTPKKRFSL
jgi:hypothetical protein